MNLKNAALNFVGVLVGVAGASFINKKGTEAVEGLMGEETTAEKKSSMSKYIVPGITTAAGIAAAAMMDNKMIQSVGAGVAAAGAVRLVNEASGKTVVSLQGVSGVGDTLPISSTTIMIPRALPQQTPVQGIEPGMGGTDIIPGMGETNGFAGCI